MTDLCPVEHCSRPRHQDYAICVHHAETLERDLGDITALVEELDTTISRQTATGGNGGRRSAERPLPFDYGASEALTVLRSTLAGWVRDLEPGYAKWPDLPIGPACARCAHRSCARIRAGATPAAELGSMSGWLLARIDDLRTHPAAEQAVEEVAAAVGECWRAIDRKRERLYCGPCGHDGCPEDLYAIPTRAEVTCRACGVAHRVEARREAMRAHVDGMLMTGAEIAKLAAYFGQATDTERSRNLIKLWASRGRILAHGTSLRGEPTYPFGETVARLLAAKVRSA